MLTHLFKFINGLSEMIVQQANVIEMSKGFKTVVESLVHVGNVENLRVFFYLSQPSNLSLYAPAA